jgi:endonuclease/exonuclease/phosphatase family metal-dependent hydrolase
VGVDRRRDVDRLAAVVAELRSDVVGLQEVVRGDGAVDADQPAYLASTLSMTMVMGATRPIGTGSFGNAILTRLPVIGSTTHDLSHGRYERRGCLRVDVAVDGVIVHVFNCHFGRAFKERREQLALLGSLLAVTDVQGPRVLLGDFNEWHRGPITRGLRREFPSPTSRVCRSYPSYFPIFALDRIYWDADLEGVGLRAHRSRLARVASDHLPVVAALRARAPEAHPRGTVAADGVRATEA